MSRKFIIQATDIGADVEHLDIYYNAITSSNLIISGAQASILTSSGYTVTVPDNTAIFYGYASGGLCDGITGSLVVNPEQVNTRFFNVYISGSGEVQVISPTGYTDIYSSTGNFEVPVVQVQMDYTDISIGFGGLFTIDTSVTYPGTLDGFYKDIPFNSANLLATGSSEDTAFSIIGQTDRPDVSDIYVVFND